MCVSVPFIDSKETKVYMKHLFVCHFIHWQKTTDNDVTRRDFLCKSSTGVSSPLVYVSPPALILCSIPPIYTHTTHTHTHTASEFFYVLIFIHHQTIDNFFLLYKLIKLRNTSEARFQFFVEHKRTNESGFNLEH